MEDTAKALGATQAKPYNLHAIQLIELRVSDLAIHVDLTRPKNERPVEFSLETARTAYDRDEKRIQVRLSVKMGYEEEKEPPFKLEVTLHGVFEIDEASFDPKYVEDWAEKNAPLVLYPYARESVFALTGRAGFPEALLPLLEIPTFKLRREPLEN